MKAEAANKQTLQGDARQHKTQAALALRAGDGGAAKKHSQRADEAVAKIMQRGK